MYHWTTKNQEDMEREGDRTLQLYHTYMRLSDEEKQELRDQWNDYFAEVYEKSPYKKLFMRTKTFMTMGEIELLEARTKMVDYLEKLHHEYGKIMKPSGDDPLYLEMAHGKIMSRRNLGKYLEGKKEKNEEHTTLQNALEVFGGKVI